MASLCLPTTKPIRTTAPTALQEPVTLAEAKHQCGIADGVSYHDQKLLDSISAARETVESDTGLVCYTGSHTWKFTYFPEDRWFELPLRPVSSITSITYVDSAGTSQTLDSSNYALDAYTVIPTVKLAYAASWPATRGDINGITVTFVAGYADALAIPKMVKQACLFLVNHWFVNTDTVGNVGPEISETYNAIIARLMRASYP